MTAKGIQLTSIGADEARWIAEAPTDQERANREASDFLTYENEEGLFADFHANRHTFISNLGRVGVSLTMAQKLARHHDPKLKASTYTHLGVSDTAAAVEALPPPPGLAEAATDIGSLRATGTDDARAEKWGQKWGQLVGKTRPTVANPGEPHSTGLQGEENRKPLPANEKGHGGQAVANAGEVHPTGFEPVTFGSVDPWQSQETPRKTGFSENVGAEVGALEPESGAIDPDLATVIEAWPMLTEAVKTGIMAMIRATVIGSQQAIGEKG